MESSWKTPFAGVTADRSRSWGLWLLILLTISVHMMLFTYGYRRTADEVFYLRKWMAGWDSLKTYAIVAAIDQGRVGQFFLVPVNAFGAYFSDLFSFRLVFVALHACVLLLFSVYCSLLFRADVTGALVVILVTMQPLTADHMPPASYPLQNTIPFLCVLVSRCVLVLQRRSNRHVRRMWSIVAQITFTGAMVTTEFAFLLGTALLAAEYLQAMASTTRSGRPASCVFVDRVSGRWFRDDVVAVLCSLSVYGLFRWFSPSTYSGNSLDAIHEGHRLMETAVRHIVAGTIFPQVDSGVFAVPWHVILAAISVGTLTALCLSVTLHDVHKIRAPLITAGTAIILMLYVTFPIAATAKQQQWCVDDNTCGYLDSRLSYLGFGVIVLCLLAFVLRRPNTQRERTATVIMTSLILGTLSTVTYAANWLQAQVMIVDSEPWRRANILACYPEVRPASSDELVLMLDPLDRVHLHPTEDVPRFWLEYMAQNAKGRRCSIAPDARRAELNEIYRYGPFAFPGQSARFSPTTGIRYLGSGWATPESWGVWSDGDMAELILKVRGVSRPAIRSVVLGFRVYFGPSVSTQTIDVTVNGAITERWIFDKGTQPSDCCERRIVLPPDLLQPGDIRIGFLIGTPRNPDAEGKSAETRRLGIGLKEIRFVE